jgi:RNA-directed DNA polymerase
LAKDRVQKDIGTNERRIDWLQINWTSIEKRVRNLRQRIYRATAAGQWKQVRSLMKLMLRSYSNLLLSVRRVTEKNQGRKTPGIDRRLVLTPKARASLVRKMLEYTVWKAQPTRRVYIPKASGKRPLGIPTISNRVAQAVVKNALEPSWEARFEPNSFGFRPGRSCHDAIAQCWNRLNRHSKDRWVLDADIKGAFDNISHDFTVNAIGMLPGRQLIKQWLKAGYVEAEILHSTESGVPQGGVISPLLLNIALNGMERLVGSNAGFIRYADDFVVTAPRRDQIEALIPHLEEWLKQRGLEMHSAKTKLVSIQDGFNFLGFTVRHFKGKCIIKPQKEKVNEFLQELRKWLRKHRDIPAETVIRYLNPILVGWANYYRHVVSKDVFGYVDHQLWSQLWRWCLRRHRNKGKDWVRRKYFGNRYGGAWEFQAESRNSSGERVTLYLVQVSSIPIVRHMKVRGSASPDNPDFAEYWQNRWAPRAKKKAPRARKSDRCRS